MSSKKRLSQIVIERAKSDQNDLIRRFGKRHWRRFHIHSGKLYVAFQPPEGVDPAVWINIISTIIAARAGLIFAAMCLAEIMRWTVGVLNQAANGTTLLFPDPRLLLSIVTRCPLDVWAFKPDYVKSLATVLQEMAHGCLAFGAFSGIDLERDIISQELSCVIEIPTVYPPWLRLLLIDLLIAQIIYGRIHRNQKMDRTEVVIYLDEADADLSVIASDAAYADMYSILAQLLRMGREYGILVVVAVGVLGHISRFVGSSFQNIAIFNVSGGDQIIEGARILQLPRGGEQMLSALKPGQCLFRENQGAWPHPIWCQIDYVPPDRSPRDVEYDSHPFIPAKDLSEMPGMCQALNQLIASHKRPKPDKSCKTEAPLHDNAFALLNAAIAHPWLPVARLWEATGKVPSPPAQAAARKELEDGKLAEFEEVRISKRNVLLIRVTDEGYTFQHHRPLARKGRGGIAHSHIAEWLRQVGEKRGHESHTEAVVPGTNHPVDAAWKANGLLHIFEVIVDCQANLIGHLETCFIASQAVAAATIVATEKSSLPGLKRLVESAPTLSPFMNRIFFEPVEAFLKELSL